MDKYFNYYDLVGVLFPGSVVLLGIILSFQELVPKLLEIDISIGKFSLLVLIAFVVGQLIQGVGNILELIIWKASGGWPAEKVLLRRSELLTESEQLKIEERISKELGREGESELKIGKSNTRKIADHIKTFVSSKYQDDYLWRMNSLYGLFRGLISALLLNSVILCYVEFVAHKNIHWFSTIIICFLILAALALYRMYRFANYFTARLLRLYIYEKK